jgi:hypothetical protein
MRFNYLWKVLTGPTATFAAVLLVGATLIAQSARAWDRDDEERRIKKGFEIAPVPLNLKGKDRALVGLGSYLVNGAGDCNGCHTQSPAVEYTESGNPQTIRQPNGPFDGTKKVNPATYMGGGQSFGPLAPGTYVIISKNLTPDKTGRAEGGHTFDQFRLQMRTGVDLDHLHPTCTGALNPTCVPRPFNGDVLQVMPWPQFQNMTDHDLRAIYEYLSSIPCISNTDSPYAFLINDCGP